MADDGDDLDVGVVLLDEALERVGQHLLLVPGGHEEREGQRRRALVGVGRAEARGGERRGAAPRVEHPPQRGEGDRRQDERDEHDQAVADELQG
ncbi:hypothetical protein [Serinibacter arcticus]|uniref:hypothetical protein n=1 Tax=Serinibacter arcticus TaxID=1655435 RepID=UPI001F419166|nr:hypothetical protein [Serinibacter arcticus]